MINSKVVIGIAAALGVAVAGTTAWWFGKERWDAKAADEVINAMTEDYNEAIKANPADKSKASFAFEIAATARLANFRGSFDKFPEFEEWETLYRKKMEEHMRTIRKS